MNLADDFLEDILQRDEAGGAAELVHHDRQMGGRALKVAQLAVQRLGLRHVCGRPDEVLPAGPRRRVPFPFCETHGHGHQVLREQDAHDIVVCAVVHGNARVLALTHRFDDLLGGGGEVDRHHVEPGRHHLVHARVGEGEHTEQHVALGDAQVRLERSRSRDQGVQTPVEPGQQPQQRCEGREGAAGQGEGGAGELGSEAGEAARQRVAEHEQKPHDHAPGPEARRPGAVPPGRGLARRHRAEHQQGEPGDVEGAMQRYVATGRDRRRIAQCVERLAHGGFLAEREQARPECRRPGHRRADQRDRRVGERHGAWASRRRT